MSQYHPNGLYAALYRCKALGVQCDSKPLPKKKQPIQKPEPEPEPEPADEPEPEPEPEPTEQSNEQSVNDVMARAIQYNPRNHMPPKVNLTIESKKKTPRLKLATPRLDNVTIEKAAKYPIAQKAFLANRRPSQQSLPDLSVTVQEEPAEEDQTPVSTPPPVLVRQVRRAPTPPKRLVPNQACTKPVAKK